MKLFGEGRQSSVVEPGVEITRNGLISKSVAIPVVAIGRKFCWKPEKRKVLIVPGPVFKMLALRIQSAESGPAVTPAFWNAGAFVPLVAKLITAES